MTRINRIFCSCLALLAVGCSTTSRSGGAGYAPGTYSGSAQGKYGPVTVEVKVDDSSILSVVVTEQHETPGLTDNAFSLVPLRIVETQGLNVDTVSGATVASQAIIDAAGAALKKAGGNVSELKAASNAVSKAPPVSMTPGTYYGEAYGKWKKGTIEGQRFGSPAVIAPTRVAVTVDRTRILSVEVLKCDDTPGFIEPVIERIPAAVVGRQSLAVDVVTGATLTSQAVLSGIGQALTQAGANLLSFSAAARKTRAAETYAADVVVVGAGGSGTVAALTAQEAGLKVVVLEKCGKVGGESAVSTGMMAVGSRRLSDKYGKDKLPTLNQTFLEMMEYTSWGANATVVKSFLENNGETADFLQDHWDGTDDPGFTRMNPAKNGLDTGKGSRKYQVLYDTFFVPRGGKLLLETTAYELVLKDGAVAGVKARRQDGTEIVVNAPVTILATGGFAGNPEMLDEYLHNQYYLYGLSTNTGDGMRMALAAGASLTPMISPFLAEFCSNLKVDFYAGYMKFINYTGFLQLGPEGTRFYNEELGASDPLAKGATALNATGFAYAVFTQKDLDALEKNGCGGVLSKELRAQMNNYRARACVPFYTIKTEMQNAIDAGEGWKADSLRELGNQIGFDPEVYGKTIEKYLDCVKNGTDTEFGKRREMLFPLDQGPFYAVRIYPAIDSTMNGIRVNSNMQALNAELKPIAGLYMAGMDAGSFWGPTYYQTEHTNAVTQAYSVTSGRIAAKHAAGILKE